jgi:hypothetical protein
VAATIAIKLPAMIRTLDTIAFDLAAGQRTTAVRASVTEAVGDAFRITKQNKILAEHATFHWCFGKVCAQAGRIPEIDKHLIRPPEIRTGCCQRSIAVRRSNPECYRRADKPGWYC